MTKRGFSREAHRQILIKLLIDIFKALDGKIGFKGGTCAFLFYDLPRISLDLDFDLLTPLEKGDVEVIRALLAERGTILDSREKRYTAFFLLNYEKGSPNIKIELNRRIWKNNTYKPVWFLGVEMKIADEATLLTNKLVVLTDRKAPVARDLFDADYFLKLGYTVNENLILERTGRTAEKYLKSLIPFIQKTFTEKNILHGLGEVLEEKQKDWVRRELLIDTIREIQKRLG
jgi:predicted nucleotidyltransferase component of viral defense system